MDKNDDGLISKEELIDKVVELGRAKGLFIVDSVESAPAQPELLQASTSKNDQDKTQPSARSEQSSGKPKVDK